MANSWPASVPDADKTDKILMMMDDLLMQGEHMKNKIDSMHVDKKLDDIYVKVEVLKETF